MQMQTVFLKCQEKTISKKKEFQCIGHIWDEHTMGNYGWPSYSELIILTAVELFLPK